MTYNQMFPYDHLHGGYYDFEKASQLTTIEIKNRIWSAISSGQPVP